MLAIYKFCVVGAHKPPTMDGHCDYGNVIVNMLIIHHVIKQNNHVYVINIILSFEFGELQWGKASKGQTFALQELDYETSNTFWKRWPWGLFEGHKLYYSWGGWRWQSILVVVSSHQHNLTFQKSTWWKKCEVMHCNCGNWCACNVYACIFCMKLFFINFKIKTPLTFKWLDD